MKKFKIYTNYTHRRKKLRKYNLSVLTEMEVVVENTSFSWPPEDKLYTLSDVYVNIKMYDPNKESL